MRIETDHAPPSVEVFVAFHRDATKTPRIRAVLRELEPEARRHLA